MTAGGQHFVVLDSAQPDLQERQPRVVNRGTHLRRSSQCEVQECL